MGLGIELEMMNICWVVLIFLTYLTPLESFLELISCSDQLFCNEQYTISQTSLFPSAMTRVQPEFSLSVDEHHSMELIN